MEPEKRKVRLNVGHLDQETGQKVKGRREEDEGPPGEEEEDLPRPQVQSLHMRMQLKVIENTITRLRRECAAMDEAKGLVVKVQQEILKENDFFNRVKEYAKESPFKDRSAAEWFDLLKEQYPNLSTETSSASSSSAEKEAAADIPTPTNKTPEDPVPVPADPTKLIDNQPADDKHDDKAAEDVKYEAPKFFKDLHTEEDEEAYCREMLDLD